MPLPDRVLVYEFLAAGGRIPGLTPHEHTELLEQGLAMRDAMLADLQALPGVQARPWRGDPDTHAEALAGAAAQGWHVWAVAPESDGQLELLARAVPPAQWLGCDADTIALTGSKRRTREHLARHGIAVPQASHASGWVVKPDDGAGATDTRRHPTLAAAHADAARRATPSVVEPWIDGEALSLSLCCSRAGAEVLALNRQHIDVDATGSVHFRGVTPAALPLDGAIAPSMQALATALHAALPGLRGYVGVDLVLGADGTPVIIEVNPRLTTAYVGLSARLGCNVAARVLAACAG